MGRQIGLGKRHSVVDVGHAEFLGEIGFGVRALPGQNQHASQHQEGLQLGFLDGVDGQDAAIEEKE